MKAARPPKLAIPAIVLAADPPQASHVIDDVCRKLCPLRVVRTDGPDRQLAGGAAENRADLFADVGRDALLDRGREREDQGPDRTKRPIGWLPRRLR